jgi:hypothetical protein
MSLVVLRLLVTFPFNRPLALTEGRKSDCGIECGNVCDFALLFCSVVSSLAVFDMARRRLALRFSVALLVYPVCQGERAEELALCHVKSNR